MSLGHTHEPGDLTGIESLVMHDDDDNPTSIDKILPPAFPGNILYAYCGHLGHGKQNLTIYLLYVHFVSEYLNPICQYGAGARDVSSILRVTPASAPMVTLLYPRLTPMTGDIDL